MEQLAVGSSPDFIDDSRLQVDKHGARDMLACSGLTKKGVESVIASANGLVRRHLTIWLDSVLQTKQLPAGVANLNSRLAYVDADSFTHFE